MSEYHSTTKRVVSIRAYEEEEVTACPTIERMTTIATTVAEAHEGELRHIANCAACAYRYSELQRRLGTSPNAEFLRETRGALDEAQSTPAQGTLELSYAYGELLRSVYQPALADSNERYGRAWSGTHLLSRVMRASLILPRRAAAFVLLVCVAALVTAAKALAVVPHSLDVLWPLLECLQGAGVVVERQPRLQPSYVALWSRMLHEGPITVRTIMQWGLWELAFRGGATGKIATTALEDALAGPHAHEIAPIAALIFHLHPKIAASFDRQTVTETETRYSPEFFLMRDRAVSIKKDLWRIFTDDSVSRAANNFVVLVDDVFDKPSMRGQLTSTIVMRSGIVQALHDLGNEGARKYQVTEKVALGLFRDDTDRRRRSLFAELRVFDVLRPSDPCAWSDILIRLLPRVPEYERYGVVRVVVAAYEDAKRPCYDPRPPRFVRTGAAWHFETSRPRPFDGFCSSLAELANDCEEYRQHVEWANARFAERRLSVVAASRSANKTHGIADERTSTELFA
jgi:hypothetical protein